MTPEQLALGSDLARWRQEQERRQLEQLTAEATATVAPLVKKTHKGELEIDRPIADDATVASSTADE